jgi:hypothetical protein
MSEIEEETKPILTPMILGHSAILCEADQLTLATWITLKMIIAENHMKKPPITPLARRKAFMNNPYPLENSKIFIASCKTPKWQATFENASLFLGSGTPVDELELADRADNAQTITFGIGRLFVHANHAIDIGVSLDIQNRNDAILAQIWPIDRSEIYWPPLRDITLFEADLIADGLNRLHETAHRRP